MDKVLLLLDHRGNRELLRTMLEREFTILDGEKAADLEADFDLAILDARTLDRLQDQIVQRRTRESPCFLPFLLLASRPDIGYATRQLWRNCDEIILTPVERIELRARTEILLRARRFSREIRDAYFSLTRQVPIGVFIAQEGSIVYGNPAMSELLQKSPEALGEEPWSAWFAPEDRGMVEELAAKVLAGEHPEGRLVRLRTAAGNRWGEIRLTPLGSREGGKVLGLLANVTTERELARMKDEFLGIASHELNTPLAAILGFLEILLADPELEATERTEYLRVIHHQAEHLSQIVHDLLNLSNLRAGGELVLETRRFDLRELAEELLAPLRRENPDRTFHLQAPEGMTVQGDAGLLSQALFNLLGNAVKFSPPGSPVTLEITPGEKIRIRVKDLGIGMSRQQTRKAWEVFHRADTSITAKGGFGLGLTVARSIVEAHGGSIALQSAPGRGTTVEILLPYGEPELSKR